MNLWDRAGVPHRGWRIVELLDLGAAEAVCEMCGHERVRYVHVMQHDQYDELLRVGCVCAESMAAGYNGRRREAQLRNKAERRARWPTRRGWGISRHGNHRIKTGGYWLTVFPCKRQLGKWRYVINGPLGPVFGECAYDSVADAKLGLFDEFTEMVSL
jgi:hypothetical protein